MADPVDHRHRKPKKKDFEGKTIVRFIRTADNLYQFHFSDGTSLAIQSELHYGLALMDICEMCGV